MQMTEISMVELHRERSMYFHPYNLGGSIFQALTQPLS